MTLEFTIIEEAPGQWRSADIDEDGLPISLRFHDDTTISPVDAIYDARVTRVDQTLNMAFLDLGNGISGALNFRRARLLVKGPVNSIAECVREGDKLRVQVVSAPSALDTDKTYMVTPRPRLMGRYVVAEAGKPRINISKDITAKKTKILQAEIAALNIDAAIIVRSKANDIPLETILAEATLLANALTQPPSEKPGFVYSWSLPEKALLSAPDNTTSIRCSSGNTLATLKGIANRLWPDLSERLILFKGETDTPAFEELGVEEAIEEALAARIDLPSGGWISITPTPALTAVDVNMGNALQNMAAAEAKMVVNMEATMALAYHMRFQDLGGLIIVDYIDMFGKGHTQKLMKLIERTMREDSVPVQHTGVSMFGLVEFTRKRSGLSLRDRFLYTIPPADQPMARGLNLMRKAMHIGRSTEQGALIIQADTKVINWLKAIPQLQDDLAQKTQRQISLETSKNTDTFIRPLKTQDQKG